MPSGSLTAVVLPGGLLARSRAGRKQTIAQLRRRGSADRCFRRHLSCSLLVVCGMAERDPAERELVARIIAWRAEGWSFRRIGAQLEAEGLPAKDAATWNRRILRQLVRQRDAS
jgi:hypothetical protein